MQRTLKTGTLPCLITDEERLQFGRDQARAAKNLQETQAAKKRAAAYHASQEKEIQASIDRLAGIIDSGIEWREVECEEIIDYDLGYRRVVRLDTGETVTSRPLTRKECQLAMGMEE